MQQETWMTMRISLFPSRQRSLWRNVYVNLKARVPMPSTTEKVVTVNLSGKQVMVH